MVRGVMSNGSPLDELCRGVVDLHVKAELEQRLASGKRLRIKAGFDPTRPDLHIGHTVLMQKMRQFQDLGHEVVFLVGDFTAMVGDPTGKSDSRPRLTREEVRAAAETYTTQAFKVLDSQKTVVRYNSEWLDALKPSEMVELCAKYTVARMLERDDFSKRFEDKRPIHVHEFLYPLLQAYDSVALENDVELGGTDQLFNLLVGRDLMPRYGKQAQIVMTTPILEGTDARFEGGKVVGAKMSKSANNYVGINEPPLDMLQKLMLVDDLVIWRFMELLSAKPLEEIKALKADVEAGRANVIAVKEAFAVEMVTRFHDAQAAADALARRKEIAAGGAPDDTPEHAVPSEGGTVGLAKALAQVGLAASNSEATRAIKQGAVLLDGKKLGEPDAFLKLAAGERHLVRVGSKNRKFAWLKIT
ncbi:MAG: tyrosine--tRNA ligase [Myxococcales bacterium]|nr:tyrosine--tRNA ligase [Myxococcales bacterium]